MADKLQRELQSTHTIDCYWWCDWYRIVLGAGESIHLAGPSILLTYIIVGFVLFMFMRAMGKCCYLTLASNHLLILHINI